MNEKRSFNEKVQGRFIVALTVLLTLLFLWMVKGFIIALILAAITAGLMYKVYKYFHRKFNKKKISAAVVVILVLLIFIIPLSLFVGLVVEQATAISKDVVPFIKEEITQGQQNGFSIPDWVPFREQINLSTESLIQKVSELSGKVGNILVKSLTNITQGTFIFFLQLFIYLYALYFFLMKGEEYIQRSKKFVPMKASDYDSMLEQGLSVTRATLKGAILIGVLQGGLIGLAFWVIGIKGAAFWGAVSVVLSLIPSIGSGFVWFPFCIWLFSTGQTAEAVGLLIWGGAVVGSLDNILRPKLIGEDTKMSDLIILISTLGGLGLFGVIGFILGPILAGLVITVWKIYAKNIIQENIIVSSKENV